jgi:hypothetical protein
MVAGPARAFTIAAWDMTGQPGNQTSTAATFSADKVMVADMVRGSGLGTGTCPSSFSSNGWESSPSADPATDPGYIAVGFSVAPGFAVDLSELLIGTRSSNTGPGTLGLFSSLDNFAAPLATLSQPGSGLLYSTIDLEALTGVTGTIAFRLIEIGNTQADGSGDTTASGTFRVVNLSDDSATRLTGRVVNLTPVPATFALFGLGLVLMALRVPKRER